MLLVIRLIVLINVFLLVSNANEVDEIDINKKNILNEEISIGKYTVFELPFEIEQKNLRVTLKKSVEYNSFKEKITNLNDSIKNVEKDKNLLMTDKKPPLPDLKNEVVDTDNTPKRILPSNSSNQIKIFSNYLEVFPKELGLLQIIVFGGTKPLILSLNVNNTDDIKYFKFKDSGLVKKAENINFNINANQKALFIDYFRYLYTNKDLPNFEKLFFEENISYFDGKLVSKLLKKYKNEKYEIKEYSITNNLPLNYYIQEDLFKNENTRAICFVSQDNFIYKDETTKYFIINEL